MRTHAKGSISGAGSVCIGADKASFGLPTLQLSPIPSLFVSLSLAEDIPIGWGMVLFAKKNRLSIRPPCAVLCAPCVWGSERQSLKSPGLVVRGHAWAHEIFRE